MSVSTDDEEKIDQMFIRLNSGEPANSAERRNAMPGPVPQIIRSIVVHPFFQNRIRFTTKRMQEYNLAAKILLIEFRGQFVDTKAKNLDQFVMECAGLNRSSGNMPITRNKLDKCSDKIFANLERLALIFAPKDILLSAQGHIPVYYWLIRNHHEVASKFRPFLQGFTEKVSASLRNSRNNTGPVDKELMAYYTMGRTTNDQASLEGRYAILIKRLGIR